MDASLGRTAVDLPKGAVRSYDRHGADGVSVLEGRVWVTRDNDLRDHVLHAGESLVFSGRGRMVVEALSGARVLPCRQSVPVRRPTGRHCPNGCQ